MLISCPKCSTSYDLPVSYSDKTHKVKCAKCSYVWDLQGEQDVLNIDDLLSSPDFDLDIDDFPTPFDDKEPKDYSSVFFKEMLQPKEIIPPVYETYFRPLSYFSAFFLIVSMLLYFVPMKKAPLIFDPISIELKEEDYKSSLRLEVNAFNQTDDVIIPEMFMVRFLDKKQNMIYEIENESPAMTLKAGQTETLTLQLEERLPAMAYQVEVELIKYKKESSL